jgi:RNA polymerase primary sigma factor
LNKNELEDEDIDDLALHYLCVHGDEEQREVALEDMIKKYKRYVYKIANKYRPFIEFDDAVQEGYMGLLEAIKRFKPEKKVKFITYATPWIKQKIVRAIEKTNGLIKLPAYMYQLIKDIKRLKM